MKSIACFVAGVAVVSTVYWLGEKVSWGRKIRVPEMAREIRR